MDWIVVSVWFVYLAIGLPYAIHINKDWFKKAETNKDEVDEPMLCIGTTFIAITWPAFFIVRSIKKIVKCLK
jgi:hypothetical protein